MLNRRLLISQSKNNVDAIIKDGLVFRLNGRNRGASGHWVDEIAGDDYSLINCVEGAKSVTFKGTDDSFGVCSPGHAFGSLNDLSRTLEICFRSLKESPSGVLYSPSIEHNGAFIFGAYDGLITFTNNGTESDGRAVTFEYALKENEIVTISSNLSKGYLNKQVITVGPTTYWFAQDGESYLGKRGSGDPFPAELFEIRIYDRKLSGKEILINQQHDINTYF